MIEISVCIGFVLAVILFFAEYLFIDVKYLPSYEIVKKGNLYCVNQCILITKFYLFTSYKYIFIGGFQYENEALEYVIKQEQEYEQKNEKTLIYKSK